MAITADPQTDVGDPARLRKGRSALVAGLTLLTVAAPGVWSAIYRERPPIQPPPAGGTLILAGGGPLPDDVRTRFWELAGGPRARIVLIPSASPGADQLLPLSSKTIWWGRSVASVTRLHARSHAEANDPRFAEPLRTATAVWIGGGWSYRLEERYPNTEVERQLKGLLQRGGVIGGTSAGASCLSHISLCGGWADGRAGTGLDLLPGTIIDQHFLRRNRLTRLLSILAEHPGLLGLGIDEGAALVVSLGAGRLEVIGNSYVLVCAAGTKQAPARIQVLRPGDRTDFESLRDPSLPIVPVVRSRPVSRAVDDR